MSASIPEPRLIAVDGNGTLLKSDGKSVSDYTRSVFEKVQAKGIPVVLVTARPFERAKPTCHSVGMRQYVITENGARAVNIDDGTTIFESWLDGQQAATPLQRIREGFPGKCFFVQLVKEGGMIEEGHPWLQNDEQRAIASKLFQRVVPDVVEALQEGAQCAKAYVTVPEADDFDSTMADLKRIVGEGWELRNIPQVVPGCSNTCDVQSTGVNKVDGLIGLCRALDISAENVWAFGDDANDIRMLTEMGWGVRMLNHKPQLSDVGKDSTKFSNDDDGVARYLEEHILASGAA